MKHCRHCGLTLVKVNFPDGSPWGHLVGGVLYLTGYGACLVGEPRETDDEMSDPTDRMDA